MYILSLKLAGYKRLMLNNINYFEYTPTSPYQIILGTNGSGKSSVLGELNPMPAEAKDFVKDGYKEIKITHRGSEYILISTFKSGNKHQFLKDGEELNPGGTLTVQREIVRREFGIYADLQDLLLGRDRFTSMSPSRRREWVTLLSSVDYSYAMGVYDKLKSHGRDNQGALKHDSLRLTQETKALSGLGDLSELKEKNIKWREELNALLLSRPSKTKDLSSLYADFDRLSTALENEGRMLLDSIPRNPQGFTSFDHVQEYLNSVSQEISSVKSLLEHYGSEYKEFEEITVALEGEVLDIDALESKYKLFQATIAQKEADLKYIRQLDDPESVLIDLESALPSLVELFGSLPDNSERVFSKSRIEEARSAHNTLSYDAGKFINRVAIIDQKLQHMAEARDQECPKCGYIWKPGYSEIEEKKYIAIKTECETNLKRIDTDTKRIETYLEEASEYSRRFLQFKQLTQSYPRLKPLWDDILEHERHLKSPKIHIPFLYQFKEDVGVLKEISVLKKDSEHLLELLEKDKLKRGEGSTRFEERLARLKDAIQAATEELKSLQANYTAAKLYQSKAKVWHDKYGYSENQLTRFIETYKDTLEAERAQEIDGAVHRHQTQMAVAESKITQQTTLQGIVADLEKSHTKLSQDQEAYKAILKALSPTEGLIADQLNGFINCITAQLNSVIASVWTYDMRVLPCGNESGELDYKFPMDIQTNTVADVGLGSTAQQEIIDFAFKITVMLYLNLQEFPLYLDELGATFDEQHRTNVMQFVKRLVDTGYSRQAFIISHYATGHGSFTNADVLVMDPRNVAVPTEYNTHVTMH